MHLTDWMAGSIKNATDCGLCGLSTNCLARTFEVSSSFCSPNRLRLIAAFVVTVLLSYAQRRLCVVHMIVLEVLDCRKLLKVLKLGISLWK